MTLRTFPDRPELPLIAIAVQDQWRSIGIQLAVYARNYGLSPAPIRQREVMDLVTAVAAETGTAIVLVTHSGPMADRGAVRRYELPSGDLRSAPLQALQVG